jgi:hypothetical protein
MYKNQFIRSLTAGVMILLFAISITPKRFFHDVITKHKHIYVKFDGVANFQASKNNFQCNWPDQPVNSPFNDQPGFRLPQPIIVYTSYINHYTPNFYFTELLFSSLRGPPSQV